MTFLRPTVFFCTKQVSRILHRLPKPPRRVSNKSYQRVSEIFQKRVGRGAWILCIGGTRDTDPRYFAPYFRLFVVDLEAKKGVYVVCDTQWLPFKPQKFDGVFFQAVLQCVEQPSRAVQEAARVLRGGGLVYGSIPLLQEDCPTPVDLWRWTEEGTRRLFHGFREIELGIASGSFVALFLNILSIVRNWTSDKDFNYVLWYFCAWFFYPLNWLDGWNARNKRLMRSSAALYYIGDKV